MDHKPGILRNLFRQLTVPRLVPVFVGILILGLNGTAVQYAWSQNECRQSLTTSDAGTADNPIVVTMEELEANPESYYGKTVTVEGELHRIFNDKVFTIEDDGFWRDKDILVIGNAPMEQVAVPADPSLEEDEEAKLCCPDGSYVAVEEALEPGDDVLVTGVVQPYDRGKLECAYGPLNLESREGHSFTKNPVIIVDKAKPVAEMPQPEIEEFAVEIEPVEPPAAEPLPEPAPPVAMIEPPKPPEALPRTAGNLALLAVAGVLALCGGLVKRG